MLNKLQIECYFKSSDLIELSKNADDIVITCEVTYPPDAPPTFAIFAKPYPTVDDSPSHQGCPRPCP